jgi:hypothetical protein
MDAEEPEEGGGTSVTVTYLCVVEGSERGIILGPPH